MYEGIYKVFKISCYDSFLGKWKKNQTIVHYNTYKHFKANISPTRKTQMEFHTFH